MNITLVLKIRAAFFLINAVDINKSLKGTIK